jgi:hypothetical protein
LHELLVNVNIALSPDDVAIMKEGHPEAGTPHFGGPGWSRTNGVSDVTVLRTAALAS